MIQLYLTLIDDEEDKVRFEHAYYRYRKLMHREAKKILKDGHRAEDAVQEAFFRIARNFHKVGTWKRSRRGTSLCSLPGGRH